MEGAGRTVRLHRPSATGSPLLLMFGHHGHAHALPPRQEPRVAHGPVYGLMFLGALMGGLGWTALRSLGSDLLDIAEPTTVALMLAMAILPVAFIGACFVVLTKH